MFKIKKIIYTLFLIGFIFNSSIIDASEDTISQWTYNYFKRIHNYMEMERFEDAGRELETLANRYFKNERSYERALINQLYGQFYMIQGDFYSAISILLEVYEVDNKNKECILYLGKAKLSLKDYKNALVDFKNYIALENSEEVEKLIKTCEDKLY